MDSIVKRLAPTGDTIRRLYLLSGNQCAFSGCNHPIINEDGTYIGELCHICAAKEGGERFDPSQTNEDRRKFENLLLLCHDHHVLTNNVDEFPVEKMHRIKADHESKYKFGLDSMMESVRVQIVDPTIFLGGEGGKAIGAGGGGGGALGSGATGGDGGSGGKIFDLKNLDIAELYETWKESISNGSAPGTGGGGAPALGENAKGGDGGNGGDTLLTRLNLRRLKSLGINTNKIRVRVGKCGKTGCDGETTGCDLLDDQENVIISLNAPGGKKGGIFATSKNQQTNDQIIIEKKPELLCAILANSVEIRNGLLFILGGAWSQYTCPHIPYDAVWPLVLQGVLWGIPPGDSLKISVTAIDPEHKKHSVGKAALIRGYSGSLPDAVQLLPLKIHIKNPGIWKISVNSPSRELANIPINVMVAQEKSKNSNEESN